MDNLVRVLKIEGAYLQEALSDGLQKRAFPQIAKGPDFLKRCPPHPFDFDT